MATRSTNLLKTADGTLIYKRRHSLPMSVESDSMPDSAGTQSATVVRSRRRLIRSSYGSHANNQDDNNKTSDRKRPAEASPVGSVTKRLRTIRTTASGQCVEWDAYCWLCHTEGSASECCCELCPRLYHKKCLGMKTVVNSWVCPECDRIMKAEDIGIRTKPLIDVNTLCPLLRNVIVRMKYPQSEPFFRPVDCALVPQYTDYIYHPMDFSALERNVKKKAYGSTEAFVADVKWILHNCIIYNGKKHPLTTVAKAVLKICRHETNEIEICPDCYRNSCTKLSIDWFCEPCPFPHKLVWAKMKGYPYWPAKVLQEQNGQVDVRFFGEHDRAWVPVSHVYLISEEYPVTNKLRKGFDAATAELHHHVEMLRERFGSFTYAALRTPYVMQDDKQGASPGVSGVASFLSPSSKLSHHQKKLLHRKHIAGKNESCSAVKLGVKFSSSANKHPSVVSKTANAVKLRYSSIISTRRSSLVAPSRSDSSEMKPAIKVIIGRGKVTDCVVNIKRLNSSNAAGGNGSAALDYTYNVSCSSISDKSAIDTGTRAKQSEQSEAAEAVCSAGNDMLPANLKLNSDETEAGGGTENETVNDAAAEVTSQCQAHVIIDNYVGEQSGTSSASDEVRVDRSDKGSVDVTVDDNETNIVKHDNSNNSISEEPATDTNRRQDHSEESEARELGHTVYQTGDDVLPSNAVLNPDETETEGVTENDSVSDAAVEATSQHENHVISDNDVGEIEQSGTNAADSGEVTGNVTDKGFADVTVDNNELKAVAHDNSNLQAPDADLAVSSDCATAVAYDMDTDSAETSDEIVMDTSECSSPPSTIDVAKTMDISEKNSLSDQLPITSVCSEMCIPSSASEMSAIIQSTAETSADLQLCSTSKHDVDAGAGCIMATKEMCSTSNDEVCEDVPECLYSSHMPSVSDGDCVSASSRGSDANSINVMSVDKEDGGNTAEKECCHADVMVAGVLSMGTELECDEELTPQNSVLTVCNVSQPLFASTAATSTLHSADITTSVPCSSPRFPFLESLVTQSKHLADNASASQLPTCVSTPLNVVSTNSTLGSVYDSTACSSALATCLALTVSSSLSYSIAQSEISPSCQLSSDVSHVMLPSSQDSAVSVSSFIDLNSCHAQTPSCITLATTTSTVISSTFTAMNSAVGLHNTACASTDCFVANPAEMMTDDDNISTAISAATTASINQHMAAEDCDGNNNGTGSLQLSVTEDILPTPTDATSSISLSSVCEPVMTELPFCFSVSGYNFQKYKDMMDSATDRMLEQFCSDILNGKEGSAVRKHMQLEVDRLKWEHTQEIKEIRHNAAIALAEQKLTLEQLHTAANEELQKKLDDSKAAYAELQRKLTREKELAVAETKKKQWCANCRKEAIFYCCWNTSYCDYPCQHQHWPQHQLTCAQTVNAASNAEKHDHTSQQQSSLRTGQQQVWRNVITVPRRKNQQRQMSRMQMVRNPLPTPSLSHWDAQANVALDLRAQAGVRIVPGAPHQHPVSTVSTTAVGSQEIVLVRQHAGSTTTQLPVLPSKSLLPPRIVMP